LTADIAPALARLASPNLGAEDSSAAAENMLAPILGRGRTADLSVPTPQDHTPAPPRRLPALAPSKAKGSPLLSQISFAQGVAAEHQALLQETLSRRKAGWTRGLTAVGIDLNRPAPVLTVRSAKVIEKGKKVTFVVDWTQGRTRLGAFQASVSLKDLQPAIWRLQPPPVPQELQIKLRFRNTATETDIAQFLETHNLRQLYKNSDGHIVAVTGDDQSEAVARAISGQGPVLFASPAALKLPAANQLRIVFKQSIPHKHKDDQPRLETETSEAAIADILHSRGLRVLAMDRMTNVWTVGAKGLDSLAMAKTIQSLPDVFYVSPVEFSTPWTRQLVVGFPKGYSIEQVSDLLRGHGLLIESDLKDGYYRLAQVSDDTSASELAQTLAQESVVKYVTPLGLLDDESVRQSAKSVAVNKGGIYSHTDYNIYYYYAQQGLERAGATPEQLKLFARLCDEAPVKGGRYNPWSGD
jgi:hypothetical protein